VWWETGYKNANGEETTTPKLPQRPTEQQQNKVTGGEMGGQSDKGKKGKTMKGRWR